MLSVTALLLDRDGTLIKDAHYLSRPAQVKLLPGVGPCLGALARRGLRFFLVSNQSGVGRGFFSLDAAHAANERLAQLLEPYGVSFGEMLFCPHAPEEGCDCRKPAVGMWNRLAARHSLTAEECLMVGDKGDDLLFAANAGLAFRALVLSGKGAGTARELDIALPGEGFFQVTAEPESPVYPHLVLSSFRQLERGLELLTCGRKPFCGA